jgi:hypothetical protein
MIRYLQPKRIIEVGSGYSSAVAMDVNERFFDGEIDCVFIDPEPDRLRGLMKPTDQVTVHAERVQDVPLSIFDGLEAQDILFLDSSHVVKAGSDVTHLFFSVLPGLKKGVHIHFHDIFWPFEYPPQWIEWQRAWSEAHLLRAFLYENPSFEIRFFSDYLWRFYQHDLSEIFPLMTEDRPGGLWLRKTGDSPGPCSQKASTAAPSTKSPAT